MTNPYFGSIPQADHSAPKVGALYFRDEIEKLLTHSHLHGNCTILTCEKRIVLKALDAHLERKGLSKGTVQKDMLPG